MKLLKNLHTIPLAIMNHKAKQHFFRLSLIILFGIFSIGKGKAQSLPPQILEMEKGLDTLSGEPRYGLLMDLAKYSAQFDLNHSRNYILEAFELAQELENTSYQARALNGMGITFFMEGQLDSARHFYEKSLAINEAAKDSLGLGINYSNLSNVLVEQGDYNKAISYFFKGLELARLQGDSSTMADIHNNVARLYKRLKMYKEAITQTKKAMNLYRAINEEDLITQYNNLGITYEDKGDLDSAIIYFRNCIKYSIENGFKEGLYLASTNIAGAFTRREQVDSARYYLNLSLTDTSLANNPRFYATVGITNVLVLLAEENFEKAIEEAFHYLQIVKAAGRIKEESNLYGHIQAAYAQLGQYEMAYEYFGKYHHLNDSLRSESNLSEIARVKERYEFQIEKDRIEESYKDELREEKIAQQRTYYFLGFFAILSILLAFNANVRRKRNKVLREKNQQIELQNREIQEQDEELRAQKLNLEALNKFKDRILAVMAHDLKSPLNSLQGLLDLSSMQELQDPSLIKEMMSKLGSQLVIVRQSVENLLHWARLQLGAIEDGSPLGANLQETVFEVESLYKGMIESKEIEFQKSFNKSDISLKVSPEILRIVLRNLLSNAFKFSPTKGTVRLNSIIEDGYCRVSVRDEGPGLKPQQQEQMFAEMMHSTEGTGKEKGTGLGLYLSGEFIRSNGGQIGVKSEFGKGSEFWFRLPIQG